MAKIGVGLKINVSEIDKARLFAGQKGKYLDATVFIDVDQLDQYGNSGMITQDVTKQEKDNGVQGKILGNCKVFWKEQQAPQQQGGYTPQQQGGFQQPPPQNKEINSGYAQQPPKVNPQEPTIDFDDALPF